MLRWIVEVRMHSQDGFQAYNQTGFFKKLSCRSHLNIFIPLNVTTGDAPAAISSLS
jgi:hypothetical protein